jgi:Flp pilus assembly pilin Flp
MAKWLHKVWHDEQGQDVAEYAVMLAVILVIVVGTIRLIGSNANNVFSSVGSAIQYARLSWFPASNLFPGLESPSFFPVGNRSAVIIHPLEARSFPVC